MNYDVIEIVDGWYTVSIDFEKNNFRSALILPSDGEVIFLPNVG
ncbi:MAG: hypothetical protein ACJASQ_003477 [Crocinitomicaceae bacterium]|jgi:hypothetical protein